MIYNYMFRMAFLIEFAGGFIMHCSKFAVVHHVVYSLWVGRCLFKSGTLPLALQKFIKIVYFSNFLKKDAKTS